MLDHFIKKYMSRKLFVFLLGLTLLSILVSKGMIQSKDYVDAVVYLSGIYAFSNAVSKIFQVRR